MISSNICHAPEWASVMIWFGIGMLIWSAAVVLAIIAWTFIKSAFKL